MGKESYPKYGAATGASKYSVASPNRHATIAGLKIFNQGGNAVDAMVAVNAALGVVFPHMSGPGGDAFWQIYDPKTKTPYILNASGWSAKNLDIEAYKDKDAIESRGVAAAFTVPGAVDGWIKAHERFGKLDFADCLQPAIDYAREGFPVSKSLANYSEKKLHLLRQHKALSKIYLKHNVTPYDENEMLTNEDLAKTLELIAKYKRESFYENNLAQSITKHLQNLGGALDFEDFKEYEAVWEAPAKVPFKDFTVYSPKPNSQGMTTLQILGILNHVNSDILNNNESEFINHFTRATVYAFQDKNDFLGDPAFNDIPLEYLLSEEYLNQRAERLLKERFMDIPEEEINAKGDTTFSCAVDEDGLVCGVTQSLYWEWGSGIVPEGTGFVLQNRGSFFTLDEESKNVLDKRKRPGHTLTNTLVVGKDGPRLMVGCMGGDGQPQTQALLIHRVLVEGLNIQEAIDQPRWLLGRTWGEKANSLRLEGRFKQKLVNKLLKIGHKHVTMINDYDDLVGHAQGIEIFDDHLEAGADPRAGGLSLGI